MGVVILGRLLIIPIIYVIISIVVEDGTYKALIKFDEFKTK